MVGHLKLICQRTLGKMWQAIYFEQSDQLVN